MKKILLSLAAVALMMSACTQDVAEPGGYFASADGNVSVTATFTPETRTAMAENANGGLDITWVEGDAIGLFGEDATSTIGANAEYSATTAGKTSGFAYTGDAEAIQWGQGTHTFYAYYPYTAEGSDYTAVPASIPAVQIQSAAGNLDHLQPYSFLYAECEASQYANGGSIDLQFQNVFSILELAVCAAEGSIDCEALIFRAIEESEIVSAEGIKVNLTDGSLDYSAATTSNEIQVKLGEGTTLTSDEAQKFYMMITPGHGGQAFQAIAVVGGKEVALGALIVHESGIPAGVKAALSLNVPAPAADPIDLSAAGTSNCYIVNQANTEYKFNATVKGNGATALAGETATLAPAKAAVLWSFTAITDKNPKADGGGWPDNLGNTKATTHLIDKTTVELREDGYIYFKTQPEILNGNVIIAATDAAGNIVWSWHMWILEGYEAAANDHYVTASDLNIYMMDRNIGATASPDRVASPTQDEWTQARGFYYQWGRKDPFMGSCKVVSGYAPKIVYNTPEGVDSVGYAQYGSSKLLNSISVQDIPGSTDVYTSVAYAVANPRTYIMGNGDGSYSWVWPNASVDAPGTTSEWGKLWGNQTGAGAWDKGGVKTMYDPCPVGYRVPSAGHFRFITSHGDNAGAYYNKMAEWKYNCVEKLFDENGEALNASNNVAPFGLNFYVKGSKTAAEVAEGAQNYGIAPEDKTTTFFPAQGCINWGYSDKTYKTVDVTAHTNQVREPDFYGYSTLFMKATRNGEFFNNTNSASYAEQQAKALPVRCVREDAVVTPEPEPETPAVVDLSAEGTANCYVVNAAATTYSFDATVMGNGAAGLTAGLAAAAGIESTTIAPASASIVWATGSADAPVVTDIELVDGKITFKTPAAFVNGNAVIAALDGEGTILWSWHIWALEGYDVEANLVNVTSKAVEGDAFAASWIDRNIGAMNNNANGDMGAYGMYYQWGRKDPFAFADAVWFADGAVRTQPTIEDLGNEAVWTKRGTTSGTNLAEAILDAVQYPQYYLQGMGNVHNWATNGELPANEAQTDWAALWGNPAANWWASTEALGSKSLFDPCPAGYRLPANAHYRFLSGIQADTYGNGSYGPKWPWRYNSVEATGIAVNSSTATWKDYTRGWNFYITDHHAGTEGDEASWDYYATGATWYFPAAGMTHYNGMMQHGGVDNANGKDRMALAVNQPVANDSKYGSRVDMHYNGTLGGIQYVYNVSNYCEGNACATPARCISE